MSRRAGYWWTRWIYARLRRCGVGSVAGEERHLLDTSAGTSSRFVTTTTTNAKIIPALTESAEGVRDSEAEEAAETRDDDYLQNDSMVLWVHARVIGGADTSAFHDSVRQSVLIARVVRFRTPTPTERTERRRNDATGYELAGDACDPASSERLGASFLGTRPQRYAIMKDKVGVELRRFTASRELTPRVVPPDGGAGGQGSLRGKRMVRRRLNAPCTYPFLGWVAPLVHRRAARRGACGLVRVVLVEMNGSGAVLGCAAGEDPFAAGGRAGGDVPYRSKTPLPRGLHTGRPISVRPIRIILPEMYCTTLAPSGQVSGRGHPVRPQAENCVAYQQRGSTNCDTLTLKLAKPRSLSCDTRKHTIIKQLGQAECALTAGTNMSCWVRVWVSGWWLKFGLEVRG
ncbi:hypothetical protein B0H13DRAFT_1907703 [Mycena leptocephala]|nr:hypothetical protein B0H13DRAFT_1907703 [Mycena leptocephala]